MALPDLYETRVSKRYYMEITTESSASYWQACYSIYLFIDWQVMITAVVAARKKRTRFRELYGGMVVK